MHRDLEAWLDQVWAARGRIIELSPTGHSGRGIHLGDANPAIWEVYKIYNASDAGGEASADVSQVAGFIDELDNLEKNVRRGAVLQIGKEIVRLGRGQLASIKVSPLAAVTSGGKSVVIRVETVGDSFVHFRKAPHDIETKHRIYLNVNRANLGCAFRTLATDIWDERSLTSAKVSGPLGASRADSVVIYLSDDGSQENVLRRIRAYYERNRSHFGRATPKLTAPVEGMPGVALAMEPPSLTLVRSGGQYYGEPVAQSFGFYRASLIFMALDRTHFTWPNQQEEDRCRSFKRRAAKYFQHAGIDPDRPAEQKEPRYYRPIRELDREIEGEREGEDGAYLPGARVHIRH
jgi:hypothetical protein